MGSVSKRLDELEKHVGPKGGIKVLYQDAGQDDYYEKDTPGRRYTEAEKDALDVELIIIVKHVAGFGLETEEVTDD